MKTVFAVLAILALAGPPALAHDWYAAPNGQKSNSGDMDSPFDIASALDGSQAIRPGDTLWIEPGVYHRPVEPASAPNNAGDGFPVRLVGTAAAPIQIRGVGRATIDGGLAVLPPATHLTLRDLEITTLQPRPATALTADASALTIPWGGLNIFSGDGCKYIDLDIHDNCQGMSLWEAASNTEVYGCLIYNNGWRTSPDDPNWGSGHGLYLQNEGKTGRKTISNCYFGGGLSGYSLHAYGEGGHVENITVDQNVFDQARNILIGGRIPSYGIKVTGNDFYHSSLALGWTAPYNLDGEVANNTMLEAPGNELDINNYVHMVLTDNILVGWGGNITRHPNYTPPAGENWSLKASGNATPGQGLNFMGFPGGFQPPALWQGMHVGEIRAGYIQTGGHGSKPDGITVHLRPDRYNPDRALLTIFDWDRPAAPAGKTASDKTASDKTTPVSVDPGAFLSKGDHYRLLDPRDFYGKPAQSGVFDGNAIPVNMTSDFRALILVKDSNRAG